MIVLTAIGRFFKKIWDWIKQTAWIQPLLIVGLIFGIIFSIPSIVKAAKSSKEKKSKYAAYYHQFKISLEGEGNSDADHFTKALLDAMNGNEETLKADPNYKKFDLGEKFFVTFVEKDCTNCESAKEGFTVFEKKLNKNDTFMVEGATDEKFKMVTIFADDENKDTTDTSSAFVKYLERNDAFFEQAGGVAYETPYYEKGNLSASDLEAFETADPDNFLTPTILLFELKSKVNPNYFTSASVTEIMFGVSGGNKNEKARTIYNCWTHQGDFSYSEK